MARIETWIFDLDNTLYCPSTGLVDQINARMTAFVMRVLALSRDEADAYRSATWKSHGITMNALVEEHGVDPADFLAETHDIDYAPLRPVPGLASAIADLQGRKIVHTNGARGHAERVLDRLGLAREINAVWAIEDTGHIPKPRAEATELLIAGEGIDPVAAVMVEDTPHNLAVPKARGMTTVLVGAEMAEADHIDHVTQDLAQLLTELRVRV